MTFQRKHALPHEGERFGKLVVLGLSHYRDRMAMISCRCDCGIVKDIYSRNLRTGFTRSCGCIRRANAGQLNRTHGAKQTKIYQRWCSMKARCNTPKNPCYRIYGGRGITICAEWNNSFEAFRQWAYSHGYRDDLEIDRINNDGNYEPDNCRFVTTKENARNRRQNRIITAFGEAKSIVEWYEDPRCNTPSQSAISRRIDEMLMTPESAITTPRIK